MDLSTIISLIIAACSMLFAGLSFKRSMKKDDAASAIEKATMAADIKYIRDSIDDIRVEYKTQQKQINDILTRIVIVEQSAKTAHKRLDEHINGG